jgi:hypothetical protein
MSGGKISGNWYGGFRISTFTMSGGEISDNLICGINAGTFTMNGGKISGNSKGDGAKEPVQAVMAGTAIINNGEFSGNFNGNIGSQNTTINGGTFIGGGGAYGLTITMKGGRITGGGISGADVNVSGGVISGSPSYSVAFTNTFTMTGGEITGGEKGIFLQGDNEAARFTMTGGTFSFRGHALGTQRYIWDTDGLQYVIDYYVEEGTSLRPSDSFTSVNINDGRWKEVRTATGLGPR